MSKLLPSFLTLLAVLVFSSQPVLAAHIQDQPQSNSKPAPSPSAPIGNDISFPQCGKTYPTGQAFGIVGVTGGLATTTNTCLSSELSWANKSTGATKQPKVQVYVNTANPGGLNTASWPQNNIDPLGIVTTNPYGICDGSDSLACAWQYGWNRAVDDAQSRFIPAAEAAGISASPAGYIWWLDVETANTWKSGSDFAYQSNAADLEGMVAYIQSMGATVGIYSTTSQWGAIIKGLNLNSSLNGLNSWLPGARNTATAKSNCSLPPLTSGSKVTITQYTSGSFDYDYSCV